MAQGSEAMIPFNINLTLTISIISIFTFMIGYAFGRLENFLHENSGEAQIKENLTRYCNYKDAYVMNNVTLKLKDGSTTQIDHILISTRGIFVIETKHYSGWIFANSLSKLWCQTIYKTKNKFQNPLRQNYKHIKVLQELLGFLEPSFFNNIVVFTGQAKFKCTKPKNVFYTHELIPAIEQYPENVISLNRVQFCLGRLEYYRMEISQKTDIEHTKSLTQRFGQDNMN